jgi:hypothetical protein
MQGLHDNLFKIDSDQRFSSEKVFRSISTVLHLLCGFSNRDLTMFERTFQAANGVPGRVMINMSPVMIQSANSLEVSQLFTATLAY